MNYRSEAKKQLKPLRKKKPSREIYSFPPVKQTNQKLSWDYNEVSPHSITFRGTTPTRVLMAVLQGTS